MDGIYPPGFLAMDAMRRAQGAILQALGFGPLEHGYSVRTSGAGWRLRDYGGGTRASLLVIAAPIKRPYIWDLAPSVSAIGHCLEQRFRVHLLEWTAPSLNDEPMGFDEYVDAIADPVARVTAAADAAPIVLGHSLGGTLAAIFAAYRAQRLAGLVLLSAPLCFGLGACRFRDAVAVLAGPAPGQSQIVPGAFLSQVSAIAAPDSFIWSRLADAAASLADRPAFEIQLRVERWTLDEVPLPGKFVAQVLEWLYRQDRFCRSALPVKDRALGPRDLTTPILAVVGAADDIAPRGAVATFLEMSPAPSEILEHPRESGVALQHLTLLIGRRAREAVWPHIGAWIDRAAEASSGRLAPSG